MATLSDLRVAVIATDGVEESELTVPVKSLRDNGATVQVIALKTGEIQAFRHHDPGARIRADRAIDQVQPTDFDALVLPGGVLNADTLRVHPGVKSFVREMQNAGRPIAAICHAPWILISANLVRGRTLTSYASIQDDLRNAGAYWVDQEVVVDRNLVTSREPRDLPAFNREMIKLFSRTTPSVIQVAESA